MYLPINKNRIFHSYSHHIHFENIARNHKDFNNWTLNHYTQLVYSNANGPMLDFVYIEPSRCIMLEVIFALYDVIESENISIFDYMKKYINEGYYILFYSVNTKCFLNSKYIIYGYGEDFFLYCKFSDKIEQKQNKISKRELVNIIHDSKFNLSFVKSRNYTRFDFNIKKIGRDLNCYLYSQQLPLEPNNYYANQREGAAYGLKACEKFLQDIQFQSYLLDDKEYRMKINSSLNVWMEHKFLMKEKIEKLNKMFLSYHIDYILQEYAMLQINVQNSVLNVLNTKNAMDEIDHIVKVSNQFYLLEKYMIKEIQKYLC